MTRIITYNVKGIRAALKKGWAEWAIAADADIICIQETKAQVDQIDTALFEDMGYKHYWYSAVKKGYSGVAILSKQEPKHVEYGCGIEKYDNEGRIIRADYEDFSVISAYFPSGSSGDERQAFKMEFLADFQEYINNLKNDFPNLIVCGDYNICHLDIDIHNPEKQHKTSGFLPEERQWVSQFIESGFIDSFRFFNQEPHHYSWWSYRAAARARNKGWRIDYNMVSSPMENRLSRAVILPEAKHSDHCPVLLEIDAK
jgi:exodeoxyribonuclease-3